MFSALVSGRLVDTMVAEVKCACMDWNVPRVPRSRKKEKTCSRLELEVQAYTDPLQLTHGPMRFMMQSSDTLRLLHSKTDSKSLSKFWGPYGTNRI